MPWILLTKKLPTNPSPPKLSIFYATPWPDLSEAAEQRERFGPTKYDEDWHDYVGKASEDEDYFIDHFNSANPNALKGMRISYKGEDIRVWAHEYSILPPERMQDYLFGMAGEEIPSHELVPNSEADAMLLRQALESDLTSIYDAALLDGCNPEMAKSVAMGISIEDAEMEFPNVGWYRCKSEFAEIYCYEDEMAE